MLLKIYILQHLLIGTLVGFDLLVPRPSSVSYLSDINDKIGNVEGNQACRVLEIHLEIHLGVGVFFQVRHSRCVH